MQLFAVRLKSVRLLDGYNLSYHVMQTTNEDDVWHENNHYR